MNVTEAIRARRSIRKYKEGVQIPEEHVKMMLEAAMMAPSACNCRPWEFFVVENRKIIEELQKAQPFTRMFTTASLVIVVCGRPDLQKSAGNGYWPQDCGAAIENILLQAMDLGYGTCWCGCYPNAVPVERLQNILRTGSVPLGMIAVGVPDEAPEARGYYDETRVTHLR